MSAPQCVSGSSGKIPRNHMKEQFCDNDDCYKKGCKANDFDKYCPVCGTEVSSRLATLYITLSTKSKYDRERDANKYDRDPELKCMDDTGDDTVEYSMREFVKLMKAYEKEVFIEEI